jgi:hypothetical protein
MPYIAVVHQYFGGKNCFHFHGRKFGTQAVTKNYAEESPHEDNYVGLEILKAVATESTISRDDVLQPCRSSPTFRSNILIAVLKICQVSNKNKLITFTTRRHIPEDITLISHRYETPRSNQISERYIRGRYNSNRGCRLLRTHRHSPTL